MHLLKMEFTRLFKQKSTYIIGGVLAILLIFSLVMSFFMMRAFEKFLEDIPEADVTQSEVMEEDEEDLESGISIEGDVNSMEDMFGANENPGENQFINNFQGMNTALYLAIFASIFFAAPYRHGFAKNFLDVKKNRKVYPLLQFLVGAFYLLILMILTCLVYSLTSLILNYEPFLIKNFNLLWAPLGVQFVGHLALMSLILALVSLTQSMGAGLLFGIIYPQMLGPIFYNLMGWALIKVFKLKEDFQFIAYTSLGAIKLTGIGSDTKQIVTSLVVSVLVMIIGLVVSSLALQIRDIK